ncbi:LANO_0D05182g1_1 [Lachancea nothofagi CBS 11611]|uniref:LANO_0D05182g1_1 n=1 Tax=Lachancea nothofagi CBS 11611 TaxID=1266666 RepID=A0A1G4JGU7_9SACH|nr:LANO_0D05182g1_1 [Lachancea nothofagi CBS 11611]
MNAISYLTNKVLPPKFDEKAPNSHETDDRIADQTSSPVRLSKVEEKPEDLKIGKDSIIKSRTRARRMGRILWSVLIFVPNLLLVKPALFIWFVVTFPLNFIERSSKEKGKNGPLQDADAIPVSISTGFSPASTRINTITEEEDDLGGDEMILQPDTVKGSLTAQRSSQDLTSQEQQQQDQDQDLLAPSLLSHEKNTKSSQKASSVRSGNSNGSTGALILGSRRMGRFLFPKKLIPQSVLNRQKRRTLVLDLDETLIHSMSRGTSSSNSSQGHMVEVKFAISGISTLYYVYKRPYCDLFLTKISLWYDLVIFTASMKEYADPVIDWLEASFPGKFSRRLYRQDCTLRNGMGYVKDLSLLSSTHAPLSDVFIIDNSPVSYAMHVDNAIQVEGWISDPTDTDLLNLLPLLEALRYTTDVRNVLALKNGERAFAV